MEIRGKPVETCKLESFSETSVDNRKPETTQEVLYTEEQMMKNKDAVSFMMYGL